MNVSNFDQIMSLWAKVLEKPSEHEPTQKKLLFATPYLIQNLDFDIKL